MNASIAPHSPLVYPSRANESQYQVLNDRGFLNDFQATASRGCGEQENIPEYVAEAGASGVVRWGTAAKVLAIVLIVVGLPILVGAIDGGERLRELVERSGPWAPLTYIVAKAAATIVAPFGGVPLKAASGALFGLAGGFLYSLIGDVIGGCVCFLAARKVGRNIASQLTGDGGRARLNVLLDRGLGGWRGLLFFRVTFPAVYNLVSFAAGSTRLPFRQYLAVTTFGGIVHTGILVTIGASFTLGWEARAAAYAGIALLALLAMMGGRRLLAFSPVGGAPFDGPSAASDTPGRSNAVPGEPPAAAAPGPRGGSASGLRHAPPVGNA
jgi:uncharacterized membrane protein YdjX (TVP38/TMEM64 family)